MTTYFPHSAALLPLLLAGGALGGCAETPDMHADFPSQVGYTVPNEVPAPPPAPRPTIVFEGAAPAGQEGETAPVGEEPTAEIQPNDTVITIDPGGYEDQDPSALTDFKQTLEPYGQWTDDPSYGQVWVPSQDVVGADFTPYVTGGQWAYDSDYTWVSDYEWGWAPFHYGRWIYGGRGWSWIPGRTYSGAWVSWRTGGREFPYVGWAPMPPSYGWRNGRAFPLSVHGSAFAFCATGELFAPHVAGHVLAGQQVRAIAAQTHPYTPTRGSVGGGRIAGGGPPPGSLGIRPDSIAHVPAGNRGVLQARAFSNAHGAAAMGAREPAFRSAANRAVVRGSYSAPRTTYFPPQGAGRGNYSSRYSPMSRGGFYNHAGASPFAPHPQGHPGSHGPLPSGGDAPPAAHGESRGEFGHSGFHSAPSFTPAPSGGAGRGGGGGGRGGGHR